MLMAGLLLGRLKRANAFPNGEKMSVPTAYLAVGLMSIIGIMFPLGAFVTSYFVRPIPDASNPNVTRSYMFPGYEVDHSLYQRRLTTFECGSEPIGDAMIQFHFQYYWYAIIFLVFDVAFMFMALGGVVTADVGQDGYPVHDVERALLALCAFFALMVLGVWHVFRKRGKIYI
jgi:NADH:ubiquinone oxidoreductase subunit 3 (subunit A)